MNTRKPPVRGDELIRAVLMMVVSAMLFGAMAIIIHLASQQLHPFQIAFFRNLFGLLFALPLLLRHGPGLLHTNKLPLYFLRCSNGTEIGRAPLRERVGPDGRIWVGAGLIK